MSDLEEHDLAALHEAVLREQQEPFEGREPVPLWMGAGFVLLIAWGGWYLGRYDARFDPQRADMQPLAVASTPAPGAGDPVDLEQGAALFAGRCAACHQADGRGLPGVAPPLDGAGWVTGAPRTTVRIVLHGLTGPVEVAGTTWNGAMPAWGPSMTDAEIAAVVSYIRTSWSNDAGPVSVDDVRRVRDEDRSTPWTAKEL